MLKSFRPLLLLVVFLSLACNSNPNNNTAQSTAEHDIAPTSAKDEKQLDWKLLYENSEQESIAYYQERIDEISQADYSSLSAVQFINLVLSDTEEGVIRTALPIASEKVGLESGAQLVIVQEERIPDDSIFGEIRFFKIRREQSKWELAEISAVWSCYPNRGHQDYSTIPCL